MLKPILMVSPAWTGVTSAMPAAAIKAPNDPFSQLQGFFFAKDFIYMTSVPRSCRVRASAKCTTTILPGVKPAEAGP